MVILALLYIRVKLINYIVCLTIFLKRYVPYYVEEYNKEILFNDSEKLDKYFSQVIFLTNFFLKPS